MFIKPSLSFQCQIRFGGRKEIATDSDSRYVASLTFFMHVCHYLDPKRALAWMPYETKWIEYFLSNSHCFINLFFILSQCKWRAPLSSSQTDSTNETEPEQNPAGVLWLVKTRGCWVPGHCLMGVQWPAPSFLSSLQGDLSVRTVRGGAAARPEEEPRPGAHSCRTQAGGWLQQQDGRRYHSLTHFLHAPFFTLAAVVLRRSAGAQNCLSLWRNLYNESSRVNVTAATVWH